MNKVYEGKDNGRMSEYVDNGRVNAKAVQKQGFMWLI